MPFAAPTARADSGEDAVAVLAHLLVEQGRVEELTARADSGDGYAASCLADLLATQGREEELTARAGEVLGIAGPNGAGKSTLVRVIAGEAVEDAGRATTDITRVLNVGGPPSDDPQRLAGPVEPHWVDALAELVDAGFDAFVLWAHGNPESQLEAFADVADQVRRRTTP